MGLIIIYRYLFLNLRHGVLASSVVWLKMAGGIIQGILVDPWKNQSPVTFSRCLVTAHREIPQWKKWYLECIPMFAAIWNVGMFLEYLWILQMNPASPNIPKRDPAKEYPFFGELRLQKSSFPTRIQKFKAAGWHDALLAASPVGPLMNGEWCPRAMLVGWETFLKPISLYDDLWIYGYMMIS